MLSNSLMICLHLPVKVLHPNWTVATMGGRFAKAKATKRYRLEACHAVMDELYDNPDTELYVDHQWEKASVKVAWFHSCRRRRDEDNAKGSLKAVFDGVVDAGLLKDDDSLHLTHETPEFNIDKVHPRVELTFTRLA